MTSRYTLHLYECCASTPQSPSPDTQCTLVQTTEADVHLTLQELFSVSGQLKKWGVRYDETRYPPVLIFVLLMWMFLSSACPFIVAVQEGCSSCVCARLQWGGQWHSLRTV